MEVATKVIEDAQGLELEVIDSNTLKIKTLPYFSVRQREWFACLPKSVDNVMSDEDTKVLVCIGTNRKGSYIFLDAQEGLLSAGKKRALDYVKSGGIIANAIIRGKRELIILDGVQQIPPQILKYRKVKRLRFKSSQLGKAC